MTGIGDLPVRKMTKREKKAASKQFVAMPMLRKGQKKKCDKNHRCSENGILKGMSLESHGGNVQLLL
jgi:hypothetical protein